jgi:hypothetical protein
MSSPILFFAWTAFVQPPVSCWPHENYKTLPNPVGRPHVSNHHHRAFRPRPSRPPRWQVWLTLALRKEREARAHRRHAGTPSRRPRMVFTVRPGNCVHIPSGETCPIASDGVTGSHWPSARSGKDRYLLHWESCGARPRFCHKYVLTRFEIQKHTRQPARLSLIFVPCRRWSSKVNHSSTRTISPCHFGNW